MSIDSAINLFLYTAVISTAFYIIKAFIYILTGADVEIVSDFTSITENDIHFSFISIESLLAFAMGFGWGGLTCVKYFDVPLVVTFLCAAVTGFIFFFISFYLMKLVRSLESVVKEKPEQAVGQSAKAYTSIEPKSQGQIQMVLNSKQCIKQAFNFGEEPIKSFEAVKIVKYENDMFYVEKIK